MKNKVIQFFNNLPAKKEEQFNVALALYRKCPHKSDGQERYYNRAGFTPANLDNLVYDLKKLVGVTDADIRKAKTLPEKKVVIVGITKDTVLSEKSLTDLYEFLATNKIEADHFPIFDEGIKGNAQMKSFCKENAIETDSNKSEDLIKAIQSDYRQYLESLVTDIVEAKDQLENALNSLKVKEEHQTGQKFEFVTQAESKEEIFEKAPDQVKEAVKFKDEFPFLLEKDCPEEFHILTGQKFAAYYAWIKAHQHLLVNISDVNEDASPINLTEEEVDELALAAVENFQVNDLIWKELNHYKESGEILGKHPIFIERQLKDKIDAMPVADAAKRLTNLDSYIRRDSKKLAKAEKAKNGADIEKYQQKILEWETEQKLIKAKHSL